MYLPRNRLTAAATATFTCVVLAACGSTLDPAEVAVTNPAAAGGAVAPGTTSDGTVPGTDTGTGTDTGATSDTPATGQDGETGSDPGAAAPAGAAAPPGSKDKGAAACDGFKNGPGISDDKIVIGNAVDISGPIPGLFESVQQAVKAYVAYFNASSDICGRKLELVSYDTRTDSGGDQEAAVKGCAQAFAMVGSASAYDNGGAGAARECGIPDMRTFAVSDERLGSPNSFGSQSNMINLIPNAAPDYFKSEYAGVEKKSAFIYSNAAAAIESSNHTARAWEKRGYDVIYEAELSSTEFNYSPYILEMKDKGVELVHFIGTYQQAIRIAQSMHQQGFDPKVFTVQGSAYDQDFIEGGGEAVEGMHIYTGSGLFESPTPELALYQQWLKQVAPGASPSFMGQFAWGAARIFTERAVALGGKLDRAALVKAMSSVNGYTANGMYSPQNPGAKKTGECAAVVRIDGGKFVKESPGKFMCKGLTDSGVGG